jgi:3-oxoadipate enol-lactonase
MDLVGPLARQLARDHQVISYQLRGEDDCFALRRRFDLADLVDDLAEFLDWFGLERPALMGVSFGGVLAMELGIRRPGRVRSLAVQGVGPRFEPGLLQQAAGMVLSRYPLPVDNPFVNQFFNLFFGRRQQPGPLFDFVTRQCWQTDQSVMAHRFRMVEEVQLPAGSAACRCRCCSWPVSATCWSRRRGCRRWSSNSPTPASSASRAAGTSPS